MRAIEDSDLDAGSADTQAEELDMLERAERMQPISWGALTSHVHEATRYGLNRLRGIQTVSSLEHHRVRPSLPRSATIYLRLVK